MAIDTLARGLAANAGGGGGGVVDVNISGGTGIDVKQTGDDVTISNTGVTNVTDADPADDGSTLGTVKVVIAGDSKKTKHVKVRGLDNAAYKDVDTVVDNTTKDSEKLPTTKAVKTALDKKIDSTAKGANSGVASLDATGKVPTTQMPTATTSAVGAVKVGDNISVATDGTISVGTFVGSGDKAKAGLVPKPGDTAGTTKYLREDGTWTVPSDTHYTANAKVTASATGKANASATNGNVYLNLIENDTVRDSHNIVGTGATTVTSDADGKITINSTDTKYTADSTSGISIDATNKKISNTGVRGFVDSKTEDAAGTIRVNVNGTESLITPKGLKSGAFKGVDTTVSSTSTDDNVPTAKAVYTAVNAKLDANKVNVANGVAPLDGSKKVPLANLPTTDTYSATGTDLVNGKAVADAISKLPTPMQFIGTLGTGGTATSLPTASASNKGYTYRVITAGTYASQAAKVGDVFVSNGSSWVYIPAGDDAANSIVMTNYTTDKTTAGKTAIANSDTVTKAVAKIDNRLTDAETGLSKKVQKTEVSSSSETTSVINVTDAKAQMAMVASIKGKTQKVVQACPITVSDGMHLNSVKTITNATSNGNLEFTIVSSSSYSGFYVGIPNITLGHKYFVTADIKIPEAGTIRVARDFANMPANTYNHLYYSVTAVTGTSDFAFYYTTASADKTFYIRNPQIFDLTAMFGAGKEPSDSVADKLFSSYVPYGSYLWNAPVESVVSRGKNMFDANSLEKGYASDTSKGEVQGQSNTTMLNVYNGGFTATVNMAYRGVCTPLIPIDASKDYAFNYSSSISTISCYFFFFDASGNYLGFVTPSGTSRGTFKPKTNAKYLRISIQSQTATTITVNDIVLVEGTTATYIPYNKTTVLVPSAVKNLPDYGYSVGDITNEIDFENGVYHHRVATVDLGTIDFTKWAGGAGGSFLYVNSKTIPKKKGKVNILSSKYTTGSTSETYERIASGYIIGRDDISAFYIRDDSFTGDAEAFKKAMSGQILVYERDAEETIPLTDFIRPLPVENGGTLTLVNPNNLDVNSTIKYKKEI